MSKYPLDPQALDEICKEISQHSRAQEELINKLCEGLKGIINLVDDDEEVYEASKLIALVEQRKLEFQNHRFNQKNGHSVGERSPYPATQAEITAEVDLGEEMSASEVAAMFNEKPAPVPKKKKQKKLSKMSLEEIEAWERAQDNSNDIYKVSARVKNLARGAVKGNLTAQGDMVCNTFTHMIKNMYDFADTLSDKETRIKLMELVRKQEEMPANLIEALMAGVRTK